MPIRMVEDDNNQPDFRPDDNSGNKGNRGGGGIAKLLPLLLTFLFKKPLIAIPLLLIVGAFFFFGGFGGGGKANEASLATGADLKEEVYDKAEVGAALSEEEGKNPLPEYVSLEKFAPQRMNQGEQGSCVGWGSSYAARTILESSASGQNPDDIVFSPSFVYNQIGFEDCQGAYISKACELMQGAGDVPLKNFGYTDQSMYNEKVWHPTEDDYSMDGFGGHCMCIIGYDDRLEGGAFQIMNSWGPDWGEQGIAWIRYKDFMHFNKEAYALNLLPKKGEAATRKFACAIGLVDNSTKQYIPLKNSGNVFSTIDPIAKGTKFKMEVQNSIECYTYIFGQETDGSSYVLFPYTPKHSAFCGITGYRLFPRDYSMQADELGNKDFMAVVVTKEPVDYKQLNDAINKAQGDYKSKVMQALSGTTISNVDFQSEQGRIGFTAESENKNAVATIVEIDKN